MQNLFKESNALLLPSLAECYGCVYCEANAFGLPALGRDTGGVTEIIKDGINGLVLATNETPEKFAERWAAIWNETGKYETMSFNARIEFEERLNYKEFAKQLDIVLNNLINKNNLEVVE